MRELLRDFRHGVRMAWMAPAWSAVAIASLALGIGANTAVFTLINALFLRPLPLRAPAELAEVFTGIEKVPGHFPVSFPNYEDFRDHVAAWSSLAAFMPVSVSVSTERAPEPLQLDAMIVTGNFFDTLGVRPGRGRLLRPADDRPPGAHPLVVLSDGLWHRYFAGDPRIVGQTIAIDGQGFTVVGVAPSGFSGLSVVDSTALWVPVGMHDQILPSAIRRYFPLRRPLMFSLVGRLRPGSGLPAAAAQMQALAAELARRHPDANQGRTVSLLPLERATIGPDDRGTYVKAGAVLMAVVGLVLVVACANVASMLLARAAGRRKEMALRLALGARRGQLLRQLLAESLVLALAAGVLGLLLALWARRLFVIFDSPYLPPALDLGLDGRVLAFSLAASLAAALLFGLVPAAHSARVDLTAMLKDAPAAAAGTRLGRLGLHDLLIVVQVALSLVCVIGTALFLLSLRHAGRIDPGFERENLLVLSFDLDGRHYQEAAAGPWLRRVVERVASLPGVRSAAVAASLNLDPNQMRITRTTVIEGRGSAPEDHPTVHVNIVGPEYFATLGIPIQRGRAFSDSDRRGSLPVAILNQTTADRYWPGQDPLGKRLTLLPEKQSVVVVGVARDARYDNLGEAPQLYMYLPLTQTYWPALTLHVRTARGPSALLETVRRTVQAEDPALALVEIRTMPQVIAGQLWAPRLGAALLAAFAGLALLLTALGVYGVTAYAVSQRRREIGIRVALGARRGDLLRLFLTRSAANCVLGLGLGILAAGAASRFLSGLLFGMPAADPLAFACASLVLAAAALAATYLPVRRAVGGGSRFILARD